MKEDSFTSKNKIVLLALSVLILLMCSFALLSRQKTNANASESNTCDLVFHYKIGSKDHESIRTIDYGTKIEADKIPSLSTASTGKYFVLANNEYMHFQNWYTDVSFNNLWNPEMDIISDMQLYAKYDLKPFKITLKVGNETVAINTYNSQIMISKPSDFPSTYGMYDIKGWYNDESLTSEVFYLGCFEEGLDRTLYAKTELSSNIFLVEFVYVNSAGVAIPVNGLDEFVLKGEKLRYSDPDYIWNGLDPYKQQVSSMFASPDTHILKGWYTDIFFHNEFDLTSKITNSITLYCYESRVAFAIKFNISTVYSKSITVPAIFISETVGYEQINLSAADIPQFDNVKILGWYKDAELTQPTSFAGLRLSGNLTVYAKSECTVSFVVQDELVLQQTTMCGGLASDPNLKYASFNITGWYTDSALTIPHNLNSAIKSHITLYAKCETKILTVTFIVGDEVICEMRVEYGFKATVPDLKVEGLVILYWSDNAELALLYDFDAPVTEDLELYGIYHNELIYITFYVNGKIYQEFVMDYESSFSQLQEQLNSLPVNIKSLTYANGKPLNLIGNDYVFTDDVLIIAEEKSAVQAVNDFSFAGLIGLLPLFASIALVVALLTGSKMKKKKYKI